jgi:hypothetical protein
VALRYRTGDQSLTKPLALAGRMHGDTGDSLRQ